MAYNKEANMWEGYIYKIENDINKKVYIGQTSRTLEARYKNHIRDSKKIDTVLYRAMRKYGVEHFSIKQIEHIRCKTKDELVIRLNEAEIRYVDSFDSYNDGYNMTLGGGFAVNTFAEIPVLKYNLQCELLEEYKSIMEASRQNNINHSDISECCNKTGKINSAGGYIWRFKSDPLSLQEIQLLKNKYDKRIDQYDYNGNLLNTFNSILDATNYLGVDKKNGGNISSSCNGKGGACGYIWRHHGDEFNKYRIPRTLKRVEQRSLEDCHLIAVYDNCVCAANATNGDKSSINQCCLGIMKQSNGFIWCYSGELYFSDFKKKEKSVDMYSLKGEYIRTFFSIEEAYQITGINRNTISSVCHNKGKTAGGYIWRFHNDSIESYKPINKKER